MKWPWHVGYTKYVKPFDYYANKDRIEKAVNKHIALAGLKDPKGFTLIEGIIIPNIRPEVADNMPIGGKVFPQIAVLANSSGLIYYFYLDKLFPGEDKEFGEFYGG